jgi:hypothetical protein
MPLLISGDYNYHLVMFLLLDKSEFSLRKEIYLATPLPLLDDESSCLRPRSHFFVVWPEVFDALAAAASCVISGVPAYMDIG